MYFRLCTRCHFAAQHPTIPFSPEYVILCYFHKLYQVDAQNGQVPLLHLRAVDTGRALPSRGRKWPSWIASFSRQNNKSCRVMFGEVCGEMPARFMADCFTQLLFGHISYLRDRLRTVFTCLSRFIYSVGWYPCIHHHHPSLMVI